MNKQDIRVEHGRLQFSPHFYFIFYLFWEPGLVIGMTQCHTLVTVTWSCHSHIFTQLHVWWKIVEGSEKIMLYNMLYIWLFRVG